MSAWNFHILTLSSINFITFIETNKMHLFGWYVIQKLHRLYTNTITSPKSLIINNKNNYQDKESVKLCPSILQGTLYLTETMISKYGKISL